MRQTAAAILAGLFAMAAAGQGPPASTRTGSPTDHRAESEQRLVAAGYQHFYNLEYPDAIAMFEAALRLDPSDPALWNHLAQARLYQEVYRIGALASELYGHGNPFLRVPLKPVNPAAERAFLAADDRAMHLAAARMRSDPGNATAHYQTAVAWGLRGTDDFVLRKAYFSALRDAMRARDEAARAVALDSSWIAPRLILGVEDYVAGSLPWTVKVLASMTGFGGGKQKGIGQLRMVAQSGSGASTDARVLLVIVYRREGWNRLATPLLAKLKRDYPRNVLFAVEYAEAAEAAGEHDVAMAAYRDVLAKAAAGAAGYQHAPLDKVWYDLGNIDRLFSRRAAALEDFHKAEAAPGADPRYVQAAALAAGEMEDLAGDRAAARTDYRRCIEIDAASPAGRAARRYVRHAYQPKLGV